MEKSCTGGRWAAARKAGPRGRTPAARGDATGTGTGATGTSATSANSATGTVSSNLFDFPHFVFHTFSDFL